MDLELVRKELNKYDNAIKNLIVLRMSLIPIVADIKKKNNMPIFQKEREEEIYKNIQTFSIENGIDENLIKDIYKLIIKSAIKTEEEVIEGCNNLNLHKEEKDFQDSYTEKCFSKLDYILEEELPNVIKEIEKSKNLTLKDEATLYYNKKINN